MSKAQTSSSKVISSKPTAKLTTKAKVVSSKTINIAGVSFKVDADDVQAIKDLGGLMVTNSRGRTYLRTSYSSDGFRPYVARILAKKKGLDVQGHIVKYRDNNSCNLTGANLYVAG